VRIESRIFLREVALLAYEPLGEVVLLFKMPKARRSKPLPLFLWKEYVGDN